MSQAAPIEFSPTETGGLPLLEIAEGLANGVHTLLPGCTAGVVIAIGDEWQLLAERGPSDVVGSFDEAIASRVRESDAPVERAGYLIAPFSSVTAHVLLVVIGDAGKELPTRAFAVIQPLLDAGGILLDRALALQERDRARRRVVVLCQDRSGRGPHSLPDLEHSLTLLWPGGAVRFFDRAQLAGGSWSERRIVRTACDLERPAIARRPVLAGLLARDFRYQLAIPLQGRRGALVIDMPAGGEELDTQSVAAAISLIGEPTSLRAVGVHGV